MTLPYTLNYFVLMFSGCKGNDFVAIDNNDVPFHSIFLNAYMWSNSKDAQRYADEYSEYNLKLFNVQINLYAMERK